LKDIQLLFPDSQNHGKEVAWITTIKRLWKIIFEKQQLTVLMSFLLLRVPGGKETLFGK
jgi:hypothetical protein